MITTTRYTCALANSPAEVLAAQALRFQVFNLELEEGLDHSYLANLDRDKFDQVCEHLIVRDLKTGDVVGTYRFQTGTKAAAHFGYYSDQEFELGNLEPYRQEILELGRACIAREHRNHTVLNLLWKEIANQAGRCGARYLVGCSSLTSQDPVQGLATYEFLARDHLAPPSLQVSPHPDYRCTPPSEDVSEIQHTVSIPRLLSSYLMLGAKIGGPPALDQAFKTIDFLTILDLKALPTRAWRRFLT